MGHGYWAWVPSMFGGLQGRHSQIPSIPDVEIVHPYKMFEEIEEIVIYFKVSVVGPRSVYLFACVCGLWAGFVPSE